MAGSCRSKKKVTWDILAGDSSLPRNRPGRAGRLLIFPVPAYAAASTVRYPFPIVLQFSLLAPMSASFRLNTTDKLMIQ